MLGGSCAPAMRLGELSVQESQFLRFRLLLPLAASKS